MPVTKNNVPYEQDTGIHVGTKRAKAERENISGEAKVSGETYRTRKCLANNLALRSSLCQVGNVWLYP